MIHNHMLNERIRPQPTRRIDPTHAERQGRQFGRMIEDIKRGPDFLAAELNEKLGTITAILTGKASMADMNRVIEKAAEAYPIQRGAFEVVHDDTDDGAVIMHADEVANTKRTFIRVNGRGGNVEYYDYWDSAMSRVGMQLKPEKIRPLVTVKDTDPDNPEAVYNKGHFQHQTTFYIGEINYYYRDSAGSHMIEMNTGDSSYHTPYVPHTFTNRDPTQEAYIMAVTFGLKLEAATQQELSVLSPRKVAETLIDLSSSQSAFSGLLKMKLGESLMPPQVLTQLSNIGVERINALLKGEDVPQPEELVQLAHTLGVNVRDLMPPDAATADQVVVMKKKDNKQWHYPNEENPTYLIRKLAGSTKVSAAQSISLQPLNRGKSVNEKSFDLTTPMHTFGYNYSDEPADLYWEGAKGVRHSILEPGTSFYMKPLVGYTVRSSGAPSELLIMKIGGNLWGDTFFELSSLQEKAVSRLLQETGTGKWY